MWAATLQTSLQAEMETMACINEPKMQFVGWSLHYLRLKDIKYEYSSRAIVKQLTENRFLIIWKAQQFAEYCSQLQLVQHWTSVIRQLYN